MARNEAPTKTRKRSATATPRTYGTAPALDPSYGDRARSIARPACSPTSSYSLKNAIDFVYKEWNNKAAGFGGYGGGGAVRAIEQLRLVLAECQVATVRAQVGLSLFADFENFTVFKPGTHHGASMNALLNQVVAWSRALQSLRA